MLHIAKGRAPLVYTWPYPAIQAGFPWQAEMRVWDEAEAPVDLRLYSFLARIVDQSDRVVATAVVSAPAAGVIRWTFADTSLTNATADVYRFTLDAGLAEGVAQRLVDARVPVREGAVVMGSAAPISEGQPGTGLEEVFFTGNQTMAYITQVALGRIEEFPTGDYPNASNTGPTIALTNHTGTITLPASPAGAGTIIEGLRINNGFIQVNRNPNVIIRNCEINSIDYYGIDGDNAPFLLVEDCRITGVGGAGGMILGNGTARRCDISGYGNGIFFGGGPNLIEDNYIHDLFQLGEDPHYDGMQCNSAFNTVIQHNTIIGRDTSHVFMKNVSGPITNVKVLNNQFLPDPIDGGPGINVYADTGSGMGLIDNIEIAYNVGVLGNYFGFAISPDVTNINIHDNILTDDAGTMRPVLNSLAPNFVEIGSADFTMTVVGANFTSTSVINFGGAPLATTFVNPASLTAPVSMAGLSIGNIPVKITDGPLTSAATLTFQIRAVAGPGTVYTFYSGAAPTGVASSDTELTIGARVDPLVPGKVAAILWYRPHANAATTGKVGLWLLDGTLYDIVPFTGKNTVGWQRVPLTYTGSLSASLAYMVGVWLPPGSDGNSWFQVQAGQFTTAGLTIPGVIDMVKNDSVSDRGFIRHNNYFKYFAGDIAMPDGSVGGNSYFVDLEFTPD